MFWRGVKLKEIYMGVVNAIKLILLLDRDIYEIISLSLFVSLSSTFIAGIIAVPIGIYIGIKDFKGKKAVIRIINTLMGLPPVLAGLLVYLLVSRKGPFGYTGLLFTPTAMVIAQILLVFPIICGITINISTVSGNMVYEALFTLNAKKSYILYYLVKEIRIQILGAVSAGFGRAISEVGGIMLVGGNIAHNTRTLTTFIVLQTGMGNFEKAIAAGIVLLIISCLVNSLISKTIKGNRYEN